MIQEHLDLCRTCNHVATCMNRGTSERPKFYCEQFDAWVPLSPAPFNRSGVNAPREGVPSSQYKGLCFNCEDRETCALSRPDGGVWHCEEYR